MLIYEKEKCTVNNNLVLKNQFQHSNAKRFHTPVTWVHVMTEVMCVLRGCMRNIMFLTTTSLWKIQITTPLWCEGTCIRIFPTTCYYYYLKIWFNVPKGGRVRFRCCISSTLLKRGFTHDRMLIRNDMMRNTNGWITKSNDFDVFFKQMVKHWY